MLQLFCLKQCCIIYCSHFTASSSSVVHPFSRPISVPFTGPGQFQSDGYFLPVNVLSYVDLIVFDTVTASAAAFCSVSVSNGSRSWLRTRFCHLGGPPPLIQSCHLLLTTAVMSSSGFQMKPRVGHIWTNISIVVSMPHCGTIKDYLMSDKHTYL